MEKALKVISVNISKEKGTVKNSVSSIILNEKGVKNDAHSGDWHRQVSLLGSDSFKKFSVLAGREMKYGEFAENLTTEGVILYKTSPLDRFINDNVEIEVTQIGKKCHGDRCAIFQEVGNCVMPKEGIFCRVVKGGEVKPGDILRYHPKVFKAVVITLSDRASRGEYEDRSGPRVVQLLQEFFEKTNKHFEIEPHIIPDDKKELNDLIVKSVNDNVDFIITTGGTGISERDITPDVVRNLLDKELPGIMELIRVKYGQEKPNALLSRGVAGIIGKCQVYTLPGSVKAVNEYMLEILKTLDHLVFMMYGLDVH